MPRRLPLCLVLAVTGGLLAGCGGNAADGVRVEPVGRATVTEVVEAAATVTPRAAVTLNAPAEATVAEVAVRDGQRVGAGALLVRLDSPTAQRRLQQAQEALAQAGAAQVNPAPADLSGLQAQLDASAAAGFTAARAVATALPNGSTRERALAQVADAERRYLATAQQARAAAAGLSTGLGDLSAALRALGEAQRGQARLAVDVAQQTVDALTVRAPISGVVSLGGGSGGSGTDASQLLASLPPGAAGSAAQALSSGAGRPGSRADTVAKGLPVSSGTTLATVTDASSLSLTADVDETDVLQVRPGVTAKVQLDAVPDASYGAKVASVDVSPTQSNRGGVSYRVRLALSGGRLPDGTPAPTPRPGMSAVADLQVRRAVAAVAVPAAAVVRDGPKATVWVAAAGQARARPVELGAEGEDVVQVLRGVRVGDRVVAHGADQVREGQQLPE